MNMDSINEKVDRRLMVRLRIYIVVMLALLVVIVFEVLQGKFSIQWVLVGILIGLGIGIIVSRVYNLSWDEESNNVIGTIDGIGAVILLSYLLFVFTKMDVMGYWVEGNTLFAIILGITTGTMMGRVLTTKRGIEKILKALEI
jgi:hypothetical protein